MIPVSANALTVHAVATTADADAYAKGVLDVWLVARVWVRVKGTRGDLGRGRSLSLVGSGAIVGRERGRRGRLRGRGGIGGLRRGGRLMLCCGGKWRRERN